MSYIIKNQIYILILKYSIICLILNVNKSYFVFFLVPKNKMAYCEKKIKYKTDQKNYISVVGPINAINKVRRGLNIE